MGYVIGSALQGVIFGIICYLLYRTLNLSIPALFSPRWWKYWAILFTLSVIMNLYLISGYSGPIIIAGEFVWSFTFLFVMSVLVFKFPKSSA